MSPVTEAGRPCHVDTCETRGGSELGLGLGSVGVESSGVEWSRVESSGVEWSGVEWSRVESRRVEASQLALPRKASMYIWRGQ